MPANSEKSSLIEHSKQRTFILRCWTTPEGQARLRLIDVQSGRGYYLEQIERLNALISSLTQSEQSEETTP
ncbi:MAG: hypothetical protein JXA78_06865 [Anaerolineales bacterium]|nr:hypothetical protein [Anaerolineales bacterium]